MKTHETHLQILHHFKGGGVINLRTSELTQFTKFQGGGWGGSSEISGDGVVYLRSLISLNLTQFTKFQGGNISDIYL